MKEEGEGTEAVGEARGELVAEVVDGAGEGGV